MAFQKQTVAVEQLPEKFSGKQRSKFFGEIMRHLNMDRPCLVIDCSKLIQMDRQIILLLLCCLEEAMKRNGDVRLAGASAQSRAALQAAGAETLFSFYETSAEAVASFQRRAVGFPHRESPSAGPMQSEQNVA
jgi:anti-sigma B factor antagonist